MDTPSTGIEIALATKSNENGDKIKLFYESASQISVENRFGGNEFPGWAFHCVSPQSRTTTLRKVKPE